MRAGITRAVAEDGVQSCLLRNGGSGWAGFRVILETNRMGVGLREAQSVVLCRESITTEFKFNRVVNEISCTIGGLTDRVVSWPKQDTLHYPGNPLIARRQYNHDVSNEFPPPLKHKG